MSTKSAFIMKFMLILFPFRLCACQPQVMQDVVVHLVSAPIRVESRSDDRIRLQSQRSRDFICFDAKGKLIIKVMTVVLSVMFASCTSRPAHHILHITPCTQHPAHHTLYTTSCTSHPVQSISHPAHHILHIHSAHHILRTTSCTSQHTHHILAAHHILHVTSSSSHPVWKTFHDRRISRQCYFILQTAV